MALAGHTAGFRKACLSEGSAARGAGASRLPKATKAAAAGSGGLAECRRLPEACGARLGKGAAAARRWLLLPECRRLAEA